MSSIQSDATPRKQRKGWFLNSASDRSHLKFPKVSKPKPVANPDGEVMTVGELVAMVRRGQDISAYRRPLIRLDADDDADEAFDVHGYQMMDFSEQREAAIEHGQRVADLREQIRQRSPDPQPDAEGADGTSANPPDPKGRGAGEVRSDGNRTKEGTGASDPPGRRGPKGGEGLVGEP